VFVAWRDLRFAKGRFALMGVVVVLMTLLVTLVSGLTAGLARGSTSAITGLNADHVAFAAPADGQSPSFTESSVTAQQWHRWATVPGVESADPVGISTTKASTHAGTAAVSAFGVQPGSRLAPEPGRLGPGQVVLSTGAADALSAHAGQRVTLSGQTLRVAGVAGDASFSHTPVAWLSLGDWQHATHETGDATAIALSTNGHANLPAADSRLGTDTVTRSAATSAIGSFTSENNSLQLMRGLLFAISALVIGAFFTVWTIQRSRDVAVLKALGATTRYLLRDALGQALVLLGLGTVIGAGIAAGAGALVAGTVPFLLSIGTIVIPTVVMIALGLAGAGLAIRRITSVDPLSALSAH
jgi:putative ABC transport system permease protein